MSTLPRDGSPATATASHPDTLSVHPGPAGTATTGAPGGSTADGQRPLSGNLGVASIVFMVVAAAAPLTVIGGSAPLGFALGNGVGFPAMFAIAAIVLLLFSVGFSAMSRFVPRAGAFFTYIGYGLGRPWGLGAAMLALVTYTAIQLAVHGYIGAQLSLVISDLGGPAVPWWVCALAVIAVVGVLGYRHIELSSKVLGLLLVAEVSIVVLLDVLVGARGGAEGLSLVSFEPAEVFSGPWGIGLTFAVAGFIGFEATAIFRDEARTPEKTIPRATYAAVILIGVFYTVSSWALVMSWGPSQVVAVAAADPEGFIVATAQRELGSIGGVIILVLLLTSLFACVLSFHNVLARYFHAMAGSGALPRALAATHARQHSPHRASLLQTISAAVLIVVFALFGMDPVLQVFTWMSAIATIGIAALMALTALAVLFFFARTRVDTRWWQTRIAPALGLVGLLAVMVVVAINFPFLVGGTTGLAIAIASPLAIALVVGFLQARHLRRHQPAAYARLTEAIAD